MCSDKRPVSTEITNQRGQVSHCHRTHLLVHKTCCEQVNRPSSRCILQMGQEDPRNAQRKRVGARLRGLSTNGIVTVKVTLGGIFEGDAVDWLINA